MTVTTSRAPSLLANAAWTFFLNVWSAGASLVVMPVLIAALGEERYGLFVFLLSVSALLEVLDLGMSDVTVRFVAHHAGRNDAAAVRRVVGTTNALNLMAGVLGWGILFFAGPQVAATVDEAPGDRAFVVSLLRVAAVSVGIQLAGRTFAAVPLALERYDIRTKVTIVQSVVQTVGIITLAATGFGLYEILWCLAASWLLAHVLNAIAARRLVPGLRLLPSVSLRGIREILPFSFYTAVTHILGIVTRQGDRFLLGTLAGIANVAWYGVPQQLLSRGLDFVRGAGGVLFPRFSALGEVEGQARLYAAATWALLAAAAAAFVPAAVLLPDFLSLWISPEFAGKSAAAGRILAASCVLRAFLPPWEALVRGIGRPECSATLSLCLAVASIGGNIALIPAFGVTGAAYAYALVSLGGCFAAAHAWKRVLGMAMGASFARFCIVPLVIGGACLALGLGVRSGFGPALGWPALLTFGLALSLVTGASIYAAESLVGGRENHARLVADRLRELCARR